MADIKDKREEDKQMKSTKKEISTTQPKVYELSKTPEQLTEEFLEYNKITPKQIGKKPKVIKDMLIANFNLLKLNRQLGEAIYKLGQNYVGVEKDSAQSLNQISKHIQKTFKDWHKPLSHQTIADTMGVSHDVIRLLLARAK